MAWPNPNEYLEAIQYPQQAFADPELQAARVATNRFGLPRPISGNFATVFEVETERGKSAVRCFMREVTNQQERYQAIAQHLRQHPLPFMVNFEYLMQGIRVRGKWYPILKMDWVAGVRLDTYIEQHLDQPLKLRQLGERWISVCQQLQQAHIAHGDLQHGNILVTEADTLQLLDYDGLIVPDAVGLPNGEIGQRHYQHPSRKHEPQITLANFTRSDNFSSHVIGLSLFALSVDPSLWAATQAGDENLLFRDSDYEAPENSATFHLLATHADPRIRRIGQIMLSAVQTPSYLDVPPLTRNPLESRVDEAWAGLLNRVFKPAPQAAVQEPQPAADSWVFDHFEPAAVLPVFSEAFLAEERRALAGEFAQTPLVAWQPLFVPFALYRAAQRFSTYPPVLERFQQENAVRRLEAQLEEAILQRKTLSRQIVEADQQYREAVQQAEVRLAQISGDLDYSLKREARELSQLERILQEESEWQGELRPPDTLPEAAPPPSADDLDALRQRYHDHHLELSARQQYESQRLEAIRGNSDSLIQLQAFRQAFAVNEQEIMLLQRQHTRALETLLTYERITLRHFLWQFLGYLLIHSG